METEKIAESDLMILLEKQQNILLELLEYSQRQIAESDPVGLDYLLDEKDQNLDEYRKTEALLILWGQKHKRSLLPHEIKQVVKIRELLENVQKSELEFEQILGREKNSISVEIGQLRRQMKYGKEPDIQPAKLKKMIT